MRYFDIDDAAAGRAVWRVSVPGLLDAGWTAPFAKGDDMPVHVDEVAREIALQRWALPQCLHVPIAAVDEDAIRSYIGTVERVLIGASPNRALLVTLPETVEIDPLLPISDHANAGILHARQQVWVHIGYNRYRYGYRKAFPDENITDQVLSHAMNRRTAALKGFDYVRITPVSRGGNSSSGFSEEWAVELHSTPRQLAIRRIRPPYIQYADLTDLMLMLDMKLGGGVMDAVNEGQKLVERRPGTV
ncbi:hypothetical protein BjapCC829_18875 [Bradyrhizobium barranii]|uniref:Uncharacterized protein n=1 Tax=Bradyrhizobium barranii TaxID=2992140 RepID=A0ABY3QWR5_9BRAD|nr:hypothetical protein [Bradyrhizobium japonicum]UFW90482.1 hypothetical protein BjapCC829_18875 [Bradyrhizobium japonicum]